MFERIVVAIDGTPASYAAGLFAAGVAAPRGTLHLLCVADRAHPPRSSADRPSLTARCESVLASARAALSGRARIAERVIDSGQALPAILQLEADSDADLVCVGSGRARLRPGSVSVGVARASQTNVAILREGMVSVPRIARIAVGLRRGPTALAAARRALRVAAGTGAELCLLHALAAPADAAPQPLRAREAQAVLDELAGEAEAAGIERPSTRIVPGEPAPALLRAARDARADALFVGRGTRRPLRPLGRVVSRLISTCPAPLVICAPEELP